MLTFYHIINWLLAFGYWLLIASITIRVMMKRRSVSSAMSWLLIIYILPLVGVVVYLLFGELNLGKRRAEHSRILWASKMHCTEDLKNSSLAFTNENSDVARSLFQFCKNRQGLGALQGNQIKLFTNSDDALQALIHNIYLAQNNIEMVFYIWQVGGLADQVAEALMASARRGVNCRVMLDSAGSISFFRSSYPTLMQNAGIKVVEALHVNILRMFLRRMDLRQHRKMVLIDNHIAYTGSMNMVDPRFFKQDTGIGQWLDIMVRIEGPAATAMSLIFSCDWEMETGEHTLLPLPDTNLKSLKNNHDNHTIQVIASGPGFPEGVIHQVLLISIYSARRQLVMTTPYLVPSDDLLHAICTAAQRGVKVDVVVPRCNDSILVNWASRAFFDELLEAGVLIHQFEDGLLHTKSVLVDGQLSLLGTVNIDMRSLWLNFEITLVIDDKGFGKDLAQVQQDYLARSNLIESISWSQRPYWQRIVERLFYFFSPLL